MEQAHRFTKAVVGGTFDHLHIGHEKLLETAFAQSEHVTIGLAKEELYKDKVLANTIQPYDIREERLNGYLKEKGFDDRANIIAISDIFGNTLEEKEIDAIFVTEENYASALRINEKRQSIAFSAIEIVSVDYVNDDNGEVITSERIRKGEIDRKGFVYQNLFTTVLSLPETLRPTLQKPIGTVFETLDKVPHEYRNKLIISVGDIITQKLKEAEIIPAISIIDFKTRREDLKHEFLDGSISVDNKQGTIDPKAVSALITAKNDYLHTHDSQTLIISGEEDLLALPAILLAPMGSVVLYGQFDEGVVVNSITPEVKQTIKEILEKFS